MPTIAVSTLADSGQTNVGAYSLCFPYYIAGKDNFTMILMTRNNSNTAKNLLQRKTCALNFVTDNRKDLTQMVKLGFPGETTEEKMKDCSFSMVESPQNGSVSTSSSHARPQIVANAFQVFECTWLDHLEDADKHTVQEEYNPPYNNFNGITSKMGAHFILRIDRILLQPHLKETLLDGVKRQKFPKIPVDYGYRDNTHFWISRFKRPFAEPIPKKRGMDVNTVQYAADRMDTDVKFTEEACATLTKIPRIFLKTVLKSCIEWAEEKGVAELTEEHMAQIRDKRSAEKKL